MNRVLLSCESAFDFYVCFSLLSLFPSSCEVDLVAPQSLAQFLPSKFQTRFNDIYFYDTPIRNLFSFVSLQSAINLRAWCKDRRTSYDYALFGSYRSDVTSIITRHLFGSAKLFAIKQCIDIPISCYKPYYSLLSLHDFIFHRLFGFSTFERLRIIQDQFSSSKTDYLFSTIQWVNDPFDDHHVYTIGSSGSDCIDKHPFIYPTDLPSNFPKTAKKKSGVLFIGERTPLLHSCSHQHDALIIQIFALISSFNEPVYLRPRKNLTIVSFYEDLNPIVLDPNQHYDVQLNTLNPRVVLSFKSSASKSSAYYGYPSGVLYPLLNLKNPEKSYVDFLFSDGAPVTMISSMPQLSDFLNT